MLTRDALLRSGRSELAQALQALLPSFNFPRPSLSGGSDHVRPWSLHGFGGDQVLVLINGKRRHPGALLNLDNSIGRGQGMVDLNAIPLSAIERVELLREGAAARYGFGAVAGVINLVLGSTLPDQMTAMLGETTGGDGGVLRAGTSYRAALGPDGFLQLAAEASSRGATNRAAPDRRVQYFPNDPRNADPALTDRVHYRYGDPKAQRVAAFLNAEERLAPRLEAYGFAGLSRLSGEAGERWHRASDDRTVRALYPDGFLPLLTPTSLDGSATGGLRGSVADWQWDASAGYGRNSFRYQLERSANVSLGPRSPTRFDAGTLRSDQFALDAGLSGRIAPGLIPPLHLLLGGEHRSDGYQIRAGEPDSYRYGAVLIQDGPNVGGLAQPGAEGFPGLQPVDAITKRRGMLAGYAELSTTIRQRISLAATGRVEDHAGFRTSGVYQFSAGVGPVRGIRLHASYGTAIRVPSLSQAWFSASSFRVVGNQGFLERTVPPSDSLAVTLGAQPLRPERSRQLDLAMTYSAGDRVSLSAGYYRVNVSDRIILSGLFDDPAVQQFLAQRQFGGISGVRFFGNALGTRTNGVDVSAAYRMQLGDAALRLHGSLNHNTTRVMLTDSVPGLLAQYTRVFFDRTEQARLERGQPRDNLIVAGELAWRAWTVNARAQRFGAVTSYGRPGDGSLDQTFGAKWLNDLSVGYALPRRGISVTLGAENLFNVYPDRNSVGDATVEGNSNFGMFPYSVASPFGFNGRFVYARGEWKW